MFFHCTTATSSVTNSRFFFNLLVLILSSLLLPLPAGSISFEINEFVEPYNRKILQLGTASISDGGVDLARNRADAPRNGSIGRAIYSDPVHLWDSATGQLTDFTTSYSFRVSKMTREVTLDDGVAFFLSPNGSEIPPRAVSATLGLFNGKNDSLPNDHLGPVVAVEFDTYSNRFDPIPKNGHVGIDVGSIVSVANVSFSNDWIAQWINKTVDAVINYNSSTMNLSAFFSVDSDRSINCSVSYVVDLRKSLPEWVDVGFSAATGWTNDLYRILSWSFNSTTLEASSSSRKISTDLVVGVVVGSVGALATGLSVVFFVLWRRRRSGDGRRKEEDMSSDVSINDEDNDELNKGSGPKRFPYQELASATKNFAEEGKLGEGGFGTVYKGVLRDPNLEVAMKRVFRRSKQGKKEYKAEVKIISQLRHRNLVQLLGWCHERGEFLLVYEYMPNGSLDAYLFGGKKGLLTWPVRHKIALGLASALFYLQEEWEQCVVHRDVKSSNVMLDSDYNAKLGDFGLARLVDHERGSQTTVLAGTMGYLAPETVTSGKASKESDVYSFGVVALEIACGRRAVDPEAGELGLVDWVWGLYGEHKTFEAADGKLTLESEEEKQQLERLMVVGLWCAHPDHMSRPSMRQAINVLNFEAPPPDLPHRMPVPIYFVPPSADVIDISYTLPSEAAIGTGTAASTTSSSQTTTFSSASSVAQTSSS